MNFKQLYSSSKGNLYIVESNNGKQLMLECGVKWKYLQKALNYDLSRIEACLLTHDHKDHCRAINDVCKAGIDVYSTDPTYQQCCAVPTHRHKVVSFEKLTKLESFHIIPFGVNHDAADPLGFVIREKATGEFILFATDTSHITVKLDYPFSIVAIECSYSKEVLTAMVESGEVNETLAKRLLTSHMEKQVCMDHLDKFDLSKCHEIHLLHLSGRNIDKQETKEEFEKRYFREIIIL
jgi:phosphoribosyl 1,2-cyclic phosphodiesterase